MKRRLRSEDDSRPLRTVLLMVLGGTLLVAAAGAAYVLDLVGPTRLAARLDGFPRTLQFAGYDFGAAVFWKGGEGIQIVDWSSTGSPHGLRLRLMWAQRLERENAQALLAWELEQYQRNDCHQERCEPLDTAVTSTTACKIGRLNGELYVSFEVCRDGCVPSCLELRALGEPLGSCAAGDEACVRKQGCSEFVTQHMTHLTRLNAELADHVGPLERRYCANASR